MRHLVVLTDFVPLKWHDLARHIAGPCGNEIRADNRLAYDNAVAEQKQYLICDHNRCS